MNRLAPEQKYSGATCRAKVSELPVTICNVAKFRRPKIRILKHYMLFRSISSPAKESLIKSVPGVIDFLSDLELKCLKGAWNFE